MLPVRRWYTFHSFFWYIFAFPVTSENLPLFRKGIFLPIDIWRPYKC